MTVYRIAADHPDAIHPVTLYLTPDEKLARQEWEATKPGATEFTGHRLQGREDGGEWEDVPDGS